jgi:hypothetical protein
MVSTGDNNRLVQTSTYVEGIPNFSDELLELIKIMDQYETKAEIRKLLNKYRRIKIEAEQA